MLDEIKYTDIFSDKTLQSLNKKSADNLRTVGSAFNNRASSVTLLYQIREIEEPYRSELETLAEVVVRETFGIVEDNKILIRGKLLDQVNTQNLDQTQKQKQDIGNEEFIPLEAKRRLINSITQGGAVRGTFSYYMMKEYIDSINPTLVDKYKDLMNITFGVYDDDQALALLMSMAARGTAVAGGVVEAHYDGDRFIIQANSLIFPILVHEIIKGLYEILSLEGFTSDPEINKKLIKKVDTLQNEPEDLRYGKYIYDSLSNFINTFQVRDSRTRDYFFTEMYKLETTEFVSMIENIINDETTSSQMNWAKITIREIEDDLRKDNSGLSGLDYGMDDDDDDEFTQA